ncbi:MAG: 1-acylglycerol-3-phosphate O-acyltransferase [Clostridiales bacterium]|nr:1-acylglycerol-3-phosphate O-acyltransferase [Clostridiales bacterium]
MIRFIGVAAFVILFLIFSIPLLIAEWIIGKFNMDKKNTSSLAIVNWAFRCCLKIAGTTVTVIGEENVPADAPVLYVGNHRSYFDILLTYTRVPRPTGYIAKKEMLKYPLLVNWMKNLHCLFLDRKDIKQGLKTILEGIEKVNSGISICIFPEGTRNKTNDTFLPFHEGSFKIAEKSGCAIVPMSINNSAAIFEDHMPRIKKAHVVIEYGKPIYIKDMSKENKKFVGAYVQNIVKEAYFKNKELV